MGKQRITEEVCREMFANIGAGVWYTQKVENILQVYVTYKNDIRERGAVTEADAEKILAKYKKKTLGQVVDISGAAEVLSSDLQARTKSFNTERIWLIHYSAVEKGNKLYIDDEHWEFIERVRKFVSEAQFLNRAIASEFEDFVVSKGVSRKWIDRETSKRFRDLGGGLA